MNKKTNIILLFLTVIITSCLEKEIDYEIPYEGDKIVIHAFMEKSEIKAIITKTVPPNKPNESDELQEAKVFLYKNDTLYLELSKINNKTFKTVFNSEAEYNAEYYIKVTAFGVDDAVSDKIFLPAVTKIATTDTLQYENSSSHRKLIFTFRDNTESGNAYYYKHYVFMGGKIDNLSDYLGKFINTYSVYNDEEFNGQIRTESIEYWKYDGWNTEEGDTIFTDSIRVLLFSLSPEYKQFAESMSEFESSADFALYEQPMTVFSNIQNGYGIFASYATDSITLKLID